MGYTGTLMPMLSELCALAEDMRAPPLEPLRDDEEGDIAFAVSYNDPTSLVGRATRIQSELQLWHPSVDSTLSFQSSRKFLLHANAYRNAALLYLHRLIHPAGSSIEADQTALTMAYDIMVNTTAADDDMKMSLWPVFLAACEVSNEADRISATQMLGSICRARKTITSLRTRSFVVNRVWVARDSGLDWNWMTLSEEYPEELMPI
jgi:hypothetical protein